MSTDSGAGSGPAGPRASFGLRLVAAIIDGLLLAIVNGILQSVFGQDPGVAIGLVLSLAYFTYFEGSPSGQTVGKKALNIRVIDFEGGGSIGHGRAAVRWFGRIISSIPLFLGYFWMLWDRERQTWHDKLAACVVVPTEDYPVDKWPG